MVPEPGHGIVLPEVQVVDRALLVAHVDVEGEEIQRWPGCPTEDFEERWESIAVGWRHRRAGILGVRHDCGESGDVVLTRGARRSSLVGEEWQVSIDGRRRVWRGLAAGGVFALLVLWLLSERRRAWWSGRSRRQGRRVDRRWEMGDGGQVAGN